MAESNRTASAAPFAPEAEGRPSFPMGSGVLLGLGLGGFFDGIVLHQVLQWHHVLSSAGHPPDTLENLRRNVFFDGLFHVLTYVFVAGGLIGFWRAARRPHGLWPVRQLAGTLLIGFGLFNLVEGALNHQVLGLHHVNETVPPAQWIYWDLGFLVWGAAMLALGLRLARRSAPFSSTIAKG
jgi:uncharacterized membrane protein